MLTDKEVRGLKATEAPYKAADEKGLYVLVKPNGSKLWRMKYRFEGVEKLLSLGAYPEVSLAEARDLRDAARKNRRDNVDPMAEKRRAREAVIYTFESVAREWYAGQAKVWRSSYSSKVIRRFEMFLFPFIGSKAIASIEAADILPALRRVEASGTQQTANRCLQIAGSVFRYAIATGRARHNPTADLRGALRPVEERHLPAFLDPKQVGDLLRAIDAYQGSIVVRIALQLAALVFVRPGELRAAEWVEFNEGSREWRIPAPRMKMKKQHIVPLSTQSVALLTQLRPVTGHTRFLFPSARSDTRPLSDNALNAALRRMGFLVGEVTTHGFRSSASTLLNENGWNSDAIERQLAHTERDAVRAAYNHADFLAERRNMMQWWADYLDHLRDPTSHAAPHKKQI